MQILIVLMIRPSVLLQGVQSSVLKSHLGQFRQEWLQDRAGSASSTSMISECDRLCHRCALIIQKHKLKVDIVFWRSVPTP